MTWSILPYSIKYEVNLDHTHLPGTLILSFSFLSLLMWYRGWWHFSIVFLIWLKEIPPRVILLSPNPSLDVPSSREATHWGKNKLKGVTMLTQTFYIDLWKIQKSRGLQSKGILSLMTICPHLLTCQGKFKPNACLALGPWMFPNNALVSL